MAYRGSQYHSGYGGGGHHGSMQMPMPGVPSQNHQPYPNQSTPYPVTTSHPSSYPTTNSTQYPTSTSSYPVPTSVATTTDIDNALKQLTDDLTNSVIKSAQNEDLEALINNEKKLNELITDSQITKDLKNKREEMLQLNQNLAKANLALKPQLEQLKTKLVELSVRQNELRESYVNSRSRLGNTMSADTIFAILQAAAVEKETSSDQIKSDFYDGEMSVEDFEKKFIEDRTLYQLRKIKSEKMKLLIGNPAVSRAGTVSGYSNNYHGGQVTMSPPYPVPHAGGGPPAIPPRSYNYGGYR